MGGAGAISGILVVDRVASVVLVEPVEVVAGRNEVTMGAKGFGGGGGGLTVFGTEASKVLKKSSDVSSMVEEGTSMIKGRDRTGRDRT